MLSVEFFGKLGEESAGLGILLEHFLDDTLEIAIAAQQEIVGGDAGQCRFLQRIDRDCFHQHLERVVVGPCHQVNVGTQTQRRSQLGVDLQRLLGKLLGGVDVISAQGGRTLTRQYLGGPRIDGQRLVQRNGGAGIIVLFQCEPAGFKLRGPVILVFFRQRPEQIVEHHFKLVDQPLIPSRPFQLRKANQQKIVRVAQIGVLLGEAADEPHQLLAGFFRVTPVAVKLGQDPVGAKLAFVLGQRLLGGTLSVIPAASDIEQFGAVSQQVSRFRGRF